jgi:hypothetical protein
VRTFYPIYQHDIEDQKKPKAEGQIGIYLSILKGIEPITLQTGCWCFN